MIDPTEAPRRGIRHLLERVPDSVREALDTFNFWAGVSIFGIAMLVIGLYFVNGSVARTTAQTKALEAEHSAEIVANANAQYTQCITNMPTLRRINSFAGGVASVDALIQSTAEAALKVTPRGSALYSIRERYVAQLGAIIRTARLVHFPVPTRAGCRALRARLLHAP